MGLILKDKTKEKFGYFPEDLKPNSEKLVIWKCEKCEIEIEKKYRSAKKVNLCLLCSNKINANSNTEIKNQKISNWFKKNEHPLKGKPRPEHVKDALLKSNIGRKKSEETLKKMSILFSGDKNPMYGKKHTEEALEKMKKIQEKIARKGEKCNFYGKNYNVIMSTEEFIEKSKLKHKELYDYSLSKYNGNTNYVNIICKKHGLFKQIAQYHLAGCGCQKCSRSIGETKIENFLIENNILYESQFKFKDCRNKLPLPFDFYLKELNICIEYDGIQHFESLEYCGGQKEFEKRKINDNIKTNYCKNNNIKLIRIAYIEENNIITILSKELI
jgi:very-short-patch-repair endonuclease